MLTTFSEFNYWKSVFRVRAVLTIGLGGAEAPGPEQGGGP